MDKAAPITLKPIGIMHCQLSTTADTPKNFDESEYTGSLEIFPEYLDAMTDIKPGQSIVVLFWLHKADRKTLKVYPRGDRSRGLRGVFSTRSPMRPNPIAISELKVLEVRNNIIHVSGVDVLDGTPLLDIKKQLSEKNKEACP